MATNHQCHCHHTTTTTTTTCQYHCTMCYSTTHCPIIHSVSTQHPPPQIHQYPLFHSVSTQQPPQIHQYPPPQTHQNYPHQQANPATVSSLIHRISALESTLLRRRSKQPPSLRDAAARTIQTHFRAYLVRRSATLRRLQHLALIKSALNRLKSSKPRFHPHTISRESMGLLIKLDSIQGSDPMIRDGKRSISRELIRFMELIDAEKQVFSVKNVNSSKKEFGYQERKFLDNLRNARKCVNRVDENGSGVSQIRKGDLGKTQPTVKKNVTFDENENVCRLFKSGYGRVSSDNGNDDDDDEVEVEEIGVSLKDTEVEEDESSEMSGNDMDLRKNLRTRAHHRIKKNQPDQEEDDDDEGDTFVFSAPLPAKMEY
ncbi:BAG family molecular chaperone regulator 8, chloroplastic-like [Bidens hawaiensis]|uniref:BAG family molecular chaperone regulator 8, chloroplastic-like n=1 Tax=Bidens hawaiensis TaxID=980011 RepID=UPI00404A1398